jgi:hypothetical protein
MKINNKISLYSLYLKTIKKTVHLFIDRRLEVVLVFERNNSGLKKVSQVLSEQTSDSSAFLNAIYATMNSVFHFLYFEPD